MTTFLRGVKSVAGTQRVREVTAFISREYEWKEFLAFPLYCQNLYLALNAFVQTIFIMNS